MLKRVRPSSWSTGSISSWPAYCLGMAIVSPSRLYKLTLADVHPGTRAATQITKSAKNTALDKALGLSWEITLGNWDTPLVFSGPNCACLPLHPLMQLMSRPHKHIGFTYQI